MIAIKSLDLTRLLKEMEKHRFDKPILIKRDGYILVKAINYERTAYFIARVRDKPIIPIPEKTLLDLNTVVFNKDVFYVREWDTEVEEIGEPDVELKTTIIARVDALIDILEYGKNDQFSRVIFKPNSNKLIISIPRYYAISDEEELIDHIVEYNARVLEGSDIGIYRCRLLYNQLRLLKNLGVSIVKMRYAQSKPILITPYGKQFPRLWIAPWVGD